LATIAAAVAISTASKPVSADDCPNGGTVRFGVEPYDTSARLTPIYEKIGKMIGEKIGCKVEVYVATGYNAEIEAMRNGKLEVAEFGPLGYVLAHQVAKAEAVAAFGNAQNKPVTYWASVVTYPSSGLRRSPTFADIPLRFRIRPPHRDTYFPLTGYASQALIRIRTLRRSMPAATRRRSKRSTTTRSTPPN